MKPTTSDLISVIFSGDPVVNPKKADVSKYIHTGDEKHLPMTGEPVRYLFRPFTRRQRDYVLSLDISDNNMSERGYETVAICLDSIVGPDGKDILSREDVNKMRSRGAISRIHNEAPFWEDEKTLPDGAAVEVGLSAFMANFRKSGK